MIIKVTPMFPKSVFPDTAEINADGHLVIGGCTAQALADEYGTPVYVLDEATIRAKCRAFVSEFRQRAPGAKVAYACKAFINPALARVSSNEEGLGFDVVSGGEAGHRRQRTSTGSGRACASGGRVLSTATTRHRRKLEEPIDAVHRLGGGRQFPRA